MRSITAQERSSDRNFTKITYNLMSLRSKEYITCNRKFVSSPVDYVCPTGEKGESMVITIPGKPVGKARPRFRRVGNKVFTYTAQETKDYEKRVAAIYKKDGGEIYYDAPVRVRILAKYPIPSSWSKKNKAKALKGEIKPNTKPDVDNIAKIILDALNGAAYTDDKQVTSLEVEKMYSENPCVMVYVAEDE